MKCKLCSKPVKWGKFATKREKESGICPDCMSKPFNITSVARADLLDNFRPEQVAKFDDADMARLARKMADAYCEGSYWQDLKIIGDYILEG